MESHAWNIVKLANYGCFHVDTTWDSCFYHSGSSSHVYYNQSDADMLADHIWDRSKVPECKSQFGERIPCCKSLSELENALQVPIHIVKSDGQSLFDEMNG